MSGSASSNTYRGSANLSDYRGNVNGGGGYGAGSNTNPGPSVYGVWYCCRTWCRMMPARRKNILGEEQTCVCGHGICTLCDRVLLKI